MVADIAILGAGPSGLLLARLLEVNNIDYVVFERDTHSSSIGQGGTLDIHEKSGQAALKEAGLIDQFEATARYDAQHFEIVDQYGKEVCKYDNTDSKGRPEIDRKDLRALLLKSVPSERILWGHRVQKVRREQDNSVSIQFENRCVQSGFKLIVGADGTWSKARELVTPAKPLYSGLCYLQAIFGPEDELYEYLVSRAGKGMFGGMGSGKQIIAQNLGDGSYNVYIGLRLPEDWERPEDAELRDSLLQNEFADWSPELRNILAQCKSFHSWRLWAMEPHELSWETVPGIALIGDAAHPSTPFVVSFYFPSILTGRGLGWSLPSRSTLLRHA
jgi:2-polyprenyl-6-methoxyphenol hydroxylase-like FAD-dependent oxidoreductase